MSKSSKTEKAVVGGAVGVGCLFFLGYALFYLSVLGLVVWAFLHFVLGVA